jgi:hypothetical protein
MSFGSTRTVPICRTASERSTLPAVSQPTRRHGVRVDIESGEIERWRRMAEQMVRIDPDGEMGSCGQYLLDRIGSTKESQRRRRDAAFVQLWDVYYPALTFYSAAREILADLKQFKRGDWRRVQHLPEPPLSMRGTKQEILFRVMRECSERGLPCAKRVEQILLIRP